MSHPAQQINKISLRIVNGEYDEAIVFLTNMLRTLKLILSREAKTLVSKEMGDNKDENDDCEDVSKSSHLLPDSFGYDFFSSPTSSSFLKTAASVKGRNASQSSIARTNDSFLDNGRYGCDSSCVATTIVNGPQHHLQVSIFRDPIIVRGDHFLAPLDIRVCEELSYVSIYNLALSHHLKSVELASDPLKQFARQVYLHKALSLYEHSHRILMKQSINVGNPAIHSMALLSNLSQIHHALGNHFKAEMCLQYLLSTMMYVIDCGKLDLLGNSIDGFFNLILPLISGWVPAPAA